MFQNDDQKHDHEDGHDDSDLSNRIILINNDIISMFFNINNDCDNSFFEQFLQSAEFMNFSQFVVDFIDVEYDYWCSLSGPISVIMPERMVLIELRDLARWLIERCKVDLKPKIIEAQNASRSAKQLIMFLSNFSIDQILLLKNKETIKVNLTMSSCELYSSAEILLSYLQENKLTKKTMKIIYVRMWTCIKYLFNIFAQFDELIRLNELMQFASTLTTIKHNKAT